MEITVKSTKVLKTGTNNYGEWKLVKVYTDTEEYTTLATDADLIPNGSTITITNMDEDDRGKKFKKFEIKEQGTAPKQTDTVHATKTATTVPFNRDNSIETQVAFKGIMEAFSAGQLKEDSPYVKAALAWAMARIGKPIEERTNEIDEVKETPTPTPKPAQKATTEPNSKDKLFSWIAENMGWKDAKPARTWIQNKCKILPERIDSEPLEVKKEVSELMGWSL
uniref:Uncharacterized protein n=1 Tax=viral metagenome TaxID=1070528 RepID=A0A6M3Y4D6_9ZZZZ